MSFKSSSLLVTSSDKFSFIFQQCIQYFSNEASFSKNPVGYDRKVGLEEETDDHENVIEKNLQCKLLEFEIQTVGWNIW